MHPHYSLSPNFLIILLLTLTYLASFCPPEFLSLAIFALNTKMPKIAFRATFGPLGYMLCRHFLELWNFLSKLSRIHILWLPTNTLDPHTSYLYSLQSSDLFLWLFSNPSFTFVVLSGPFSISWAFYFIRNFSVVSKSQSSIAIFFSVQLQSVSSCYSPSFAWYLLSS